MQPQPNIEEYEDAISKIQEKLNLLKTNDGKSNLRKSDRSASSLSTEYQKIVRLRSEECVSLNKQWEAYRNEQKQYRKKDIEKRQVEFDKELSLLDAARRRKWKVEEEETLSNDRKKEICNTLVTALRNYDGQNNHSILDSDTKESGHGNNSSSDIDNTNQVDKSIVTLPVELLESFWLLGIEVPITKTEITNTIQLIEKQSCC